LVWYSLIIMPPVDLGKLNIPFSLKRFSGFKRSMECEELLLLLEDEILSTSI
jgi:hypothetical protein